VFYIFLNLYFILLQQCKNTDYFVYQYLNLRINDIRNPINFIIFTQNEETYTQNLLSNVYI